LLSTFGLVFVAELGDKTQLAVITQTCKYRRPWSVFLGGSLALASVTALGAIGGKVLSSLVPDIVVRAITAIGFSIMGVLMWLESIKGQVSEKTACGLEGGSCTDTSVKWDWRAFFSTFSLLFFAELGDKTQLAVLGVASKQPTALSVFLGGAFALTAVTALGVVGGHKLCQVIPEKLLLKISAAAFIIMGILMGFGVI
jgi:putative Ca2+/H+ antiporter (TMEM165/GDT1 family)